MISGSQFNNKLDKECMETISLKINGKIRLINVDPETPLLFVLRNNLGLTGAKLGCGLEQCGACAVLINGCSTLSCVTTVADFQGKEIITVEGISKDGKLSRVQKAFVDAGAAQCGYCTPGLVVAVTALFEQDPNPDDTAVESALEHHLCRCGSHGRIIAAIDFLRNSGSRVV